MGFLPNIDLGFNVAVKVNEFYDLLKSMDEKLGVLVDLELDREARIAKVAVCDQCDQGGRLRCPQHGPVKVPPLPAEDMMTPDMRSMRDEAR